MIFTDSAVVWLLLRSALLYPDQKFVEKVFRELNRNLLWILKILIIQNGAYNMAIGQLFKLYSGGKLVMGVFRALITHLLSDSQNFENPKWWIKYLWLMQKFFYIISRWKVEQEGFLRRWLRTLHTILKMSKILDGWTNMVAEKFYYIS